MVPDDLGRARRETPDTFPAGETLGQRIARLRLGLGWTQQELADRLAISRVAVSHLEMGISVPSERTIVLLAGVYHLEPLELVEGTAYPDAKAERLPLVAARYTEIELQVRLLERDLEWLARIRPGAGADTQAEQVRKEWRRRIASLESRVLDPGEQRRLAEARELLAHEGPCFQQSAR